MPLNPNIPLSAIQPRRNTLTQDYAQALQIKAAQQQMEAQQAATAQAEARRKALAGAYDPQTGKVDYGRAEALLAGTGDISGALGVRKELRAQETETQKQQAARLDARIKEIETEGRLLSTVTTPEQYMAARQQAAALGLDAGDWPEQFDPEAIDRAVRATMDPKTRYEIAAREAAAKDTQAYRDRMAGLSERRTKAYELGASQPQINLPGQLAARPLTPEEAQNFGIPPDKAGFMMIDSKGNLAQRPLAPGEKDSGKAEVVAQKTAADNARAYQVYEQAKRGLDRGLAGTKATGPVFGRLPAVTAEAQISDAAIAAMAPTLKQLFRSAGEGVFTDRDQELLLNMIPSRKDHPEARRTIMQNIDSIIRAKLGIGSESGARNAPKVGDSVDGYIYRGGPPGDPSSWQAP